MSRRVSSSWATISVCAALLVTWEAREPVRTAALPEVLTKAIAYYATLSSYSDTAVVKREAPGIVDEGRFTTYFRRASRDLYFDLQWLTSTNPANKFTIDMRSHRTVIWMFKGAMEAYDGRMQSHEIINADGGGQVRALTSAGHSTNGTSMLIPSLLYSQARLPSSILQIEEAEVAGVEEVNQRRCHKIVGIAAAYYPNGTRTGVRPVTVWIDVETQLIRRVFEDTPKAYQAGSYSHFTVTLNPVANPAIDDSKFQFKVPMQ